MKKTNLEETLDFLAEQGAEIVMPNPTSWWQVAIKFGVKPKNFEEGFVNLAVRNIPILHTKYGGFKKLRDSIVSLYDSC